MKKLLLKSSVFGILLSSVIGIEGLAATPNSRAWEEVCRTRSSVDCGGWVMPVCSASQANAAFQVGGGKNQAAIDYAAKEIGCNLNPYF